MGELMQGPHTIKACDVHIAKNKNKLKFVLHTSKTHGLGSYPQKIKISAHSDSLEFKKQFFCPFQSSWEYLAMRGNYVNEDDPFFVLSDHTPVTPYQV